MQPRTIGLAMQPRTIGLWTALCDGWARALNLSISGAVNRAAAP